MNPQSRLFWSISLIFILLLVSVRAGLAAQFETPPTLPAQDLVPPTLLSGDGFHVNKQVPTDGLMAHFTIQSDVGTFPANSIEMLRIRVAEIPAIQQLTKTSKTQVFAQSLAENAARPVQAAGQILMNPVETIQGLPSGVGRFFGRVGMGAQKIEEAATQPQSDGQGLEAAGQATRDALGYEQERRELAKKLNVDPYTTNPVLSKQLDDFALAAFRAHVAVTTSMSVFIPGSMAITATRVVSQWVWDKPKADLILQNQQSLQALGVSDAQIKAFQSNPVFPLSVQTEFVANLGNLPGVPGRAQAVALASTAKSEVQARFLTDSVGMLARYHQTQTPIARLLVRRAIIGQDRRGAIVAEAPVDYVSWIQDVSYFANRPDLRSRRRTLWITGQFSPLARKNFETLGWVVHEKADPIPDTAS
jgi:hypothetical protein